MTDTPLLARSIRMHSLRMCNHASASHIGSCLSMADLLAVLYGGEVLRHDPANPKWGDRDWFLLSKGHGAAALYAVLAERGYFPLEELDTYCDAGSRMLAHISHHVPGVEMSTGSLGHMLPVGCGLALAARREGKPNRVYVLLSDGEMDEGSNWEAILFAPHHKLDNLTILIDYNKLQSFGTVEEVLTLEPLVDKFAAFGWEVREIDGHDHAAIRTSLRPPSRAGVPVAIIAHTVKGKGVSFMENALAWHYRSPSNDQLRQALEELEAGA